MDDRPMFAFSVCFLPDVTGSFSRELSAGSDCNARLIAPSLEMEMASESDMPLADRPIEPL